MPSLGPFIGFGNGTLLFFTFAAVGVTFNLVVELDAAISPIATVLSELSAARELQQLAETARPDKAGDVQLERMFTTLRTIHPATPDETAAYSKTLDLLDGVVETRARLVNASGETVPWPLVFMLAIMGISVIVVSTVLDTQHRASHLLILTALALLVSLTLALVVSLNYPFDGILPISDEALRNFLQFRAAR